jgi:hypothetical protein
MQPEPAAILVSFVLTGPSLDPDAVSSLLGLTPTRSHRRGEATRSGRPYAIAIWGLDSGCGPSEALETQLDSLLHQLQPRSGEIRALLRSGVDAGFYCTYSLSADTGRIRLSPQVLARVASLRAQLVIDVVGEGPPED